MGSLVGTTYALPASMRTLSIAIGVLCGLASGQALAEGYSAPLPAVREAPQFALPGAVLSTAQVLLWDDRSGEYVLRRTGEEVAGRRILEVERGQVVIEGDGERQVLALALPPELRWRRRQALGEGVGSGGASGAAPGGAVAAAPAGTLLGGAVSPSAASAVPMPVAEPVVRAPVTADVPAVAPAPAVAPVPAAPVVPPPAMPAAQPADAPAASPASAPEAQAGEVSPAPAGAPAAAPAVVPAAPAAPSVPAAAAAPSQPAPVNAPAAAPPAGATPGGEAAAASPVSWVWAVAISRGTFNSYLANFEALAEQVTIEPVTGGGYRLASLRPGSILEMLGLRAGDVVLRVDGRPINTLEDAARAHAWLRVAGQGQGPGTSPPSSEFVIDALRAGMPVRLRLRLVS